ncbi:hypothetical protein [Micromonospora endophytica]|uniref:Uncharacterized protein n=1 Tax=Micromonospora endophytica TaxID=515350 RepID=A0A2W2CTI4_9ACTN|nr:hypothetical protein [Micromonospora endophytica]PZF88456.1 hypothetical protein C1I93_25000 [Micromonospora endophytica]RIW51415.1 hypothetical protein D3H59_00690 [Micromonospora endophytica]BCJ62127.1 hypothetical protein Jiend_55490 [Micromonospora endophytica]
MSGSEGNSPTSSSSYNSNLAFGGSSSDSSADDTAYHGRTGEMDFVATSNGRTMERLTHALAALPADFQTIRRMAGRVDVVFGQADGGGVGVWREGAPGQRSTIVLNPEHADVQREGSSRLLGTAIFEVMNAAQAERRANLDRDAGRGRIARRAAREGMTPEAYYGREVERIEFDNAVTHRRLVNELPGQRTGTHVDLFRNTVPLLRNNQGPGTQAYNDAFANYYQLQRQSGHTQDYENRYAFVGPPQPPITLNDLPSGQVAQTPAWDPRASTVQSTRGSGESRGAGEPSGSSHDRSRRHRAHGSGSGRGRK